MSRYAHIHEVQFFSHVTHICHCQRSSWILCHIEVWQNIEWWSFHTASVRLAHKPVMSLAHLLSLLMKLQHTCSHVSSYSYIYGELFFTDVTHICHYQSHLIPCHIEAWQNSEWQRVTAPQACFSPINLSCHLRTSLSLCT